LEVGSFLSELSLIFNSLQARLRSRIVKESNNGVPNACQPKASLVDKGQKPNIIPHLAWRLRRNREAEGVPRFHRLLPGQPRRGGAGVLRLYRGRVASGIGRDIVVVVAAAAVFAEVVLIFAVAAVAALLKRRVPSCGRACGVGDRALFGALVPALATIVASPPLAAFLLPLAISVPPPPELLAVDLGDVAFVADDTLSCPK